jgi:hypothetical protein
VSNKATLCGWGFIHDVLLLPKQDTCLQSDENLSKAKEHFFALLTTNLLLSQNNAAMKQPTDKFLLVITVRHLLMSWG